MLTVSMPPLACAAARAPPRGDRPLEPGLVFSGAIMSMGSCRASGGDGRKAGPQAIQRPMCSADRGGETSVNQLPPPRSFRRTLVLHERRRRLFGPRAGGSLR